MEASYGKFKNGFYGLRYTAMTLCFMIALGITESTWMRGRRWRLDACWAWTAGQK